MHVMSTNTTKCTLTSQSQPISTYFSSVDFTGCTLKSESSLILSLYDNVEDGKRKLLQKEAEVTRLKKLNARKEVDAQRK